MDEIESDSNWCPGTSSWVWDDFDQIFGDASKYRTVFIIDWVDQSVNSLPYNPRN